MLTQMMDELEFCKLQRLKSAERRINDKKLKVSKLLNKNRTTKHLKLKLKDNIEAQDSARAPKTLELRSEGVERFCETEDHGKQMYEIDI